MCSLRIALVGPIPAVPGGAAGGVASANLALAHGLRRLGCEVWMIAPAEPGTEVCEGLNVLLRPTGHRAGLLSGFSGWRRSVAEALRVIRPDLVHAQGLLQYGLSACDWREGPVVVTAHGNGIQDNAFAYGPIAAEARKPLLMRWMIQVLKRADAVIDVTRAFSVNCPVPPVGRIVHIPNAVADEFYCNTLGPPSRTVLFFGGAARIKGADLLMAAWGSVVESVPDATLRLHGVRPHDVLGRRWRRHWAPDASVAFDPLLPPSRVAARMKEHAVVVVPSRFEVTPTVIQQAWAAGAPVVATEVGGIPELASGICELVQPTPASICAGLVAVLGDAADYNPAVLRARQESEGFRSEVVASAHLEVYRQLLEASRR